MYLRKGTGGWLGTPKWVDATKRADAACTVTADLCLACAVVLEVNARGRWEYSDTGSQTCWRAEANKVCVRADKERTSARSRRPQGSLDITMGIHCAQAPGPSHHGKERDRCQQSEGERSFH
jgi:hypothetical protein